MWPMDRGVRLQFNDQAVPPTHERVRVAAARRNYFTTTRRRTGTEPRRPRLGDCSFGF
jgi:hypothetical protein